MHVPPEIAPANVMRQSNLVTEEFFLTTKSTNRPEKISWETVFTVGIRCSSHEIFSGR